MAYVKHEDLCGAFKGNCFVLLICITRYLVNVYLDI